MAKQTFKEIKEELEATKANLTKALEAGKQRVGKKDFYQGIVWGAAVTVILFIIKHLIF